MREATARLPSALQSESLLESERVSFPDLRAFLDHLKREGDLVVVDAPVDPRLEIAEIHRRVIAAGGPALLFTRVLGSDFPLVTNLFGTAARAAAAFGPRPFALIKRLVHLAETLLPPTPAKLWAARDLAGEALGIGLRQVRRGPVTEVVTENLTLDRLPALTCWPEDGGPFITLPLVYTEHPERGGHNLGMYRLHVHGPAPPACTGRLARAAASITRRQRRRANALPATVFLGGPPALMLAAIAPLPENIPELMLASLLAGGRLRMCPGPRGRRLVANAEFALIGSVPPGVRVPEGPFGDHYGYYSLRHDYPVFDIHAVAHRSDAIYPATVVGKPRQEDFFVGDLLQELLAPLFPLVMPGVVDLWSYGETGYHSLAAAIVKDRYPREAMASAFRILGEGQLSLTKFLFVTDGRVDLKDVRAVLSHVLARTRPETDLFVFSNLSMDTLDYTGPRVNEGSKGVWLGLGEPIRELPCTYAPDTPHPTASQVRVFCPGCLIVGAPRYQDDPEAGARLAAHPAFRDWPLLVLTDEADRAAASPMNFLWTTFTRFEPAADIHAASKSITRNHVAFGPPVAIDARLKPWFPAEVSCDPVTATLVSRRWREYFPGRSVEMGDSETGHLDR